MHCQQDHTWLIEYVVREISQHLYKMYEGAIHVTVTKYIAKNNIRVLKLVQMFYTVYRNVNEQWLYYGYWD